MLDKILFFTIAAFTLGSLGQIFRISSANLYLFDILVFGANLYLLLFFLKKKKFYINSPLILFSFFSLFTFITTLFQTIGFLFSEILYVLSFWVRFNMYFLFGIFVFNLIKYQFLPRETFKKILLNNFYLLTLLNLIQYLFILDISFMESFGFDPHTQRLTGFFLDPNFMGFYLILYLFLNEILLKKKYVSFILISMIFLTDSRSAFLTLILFLILYSFKHFKSAVLLFLFSAVLFIFSNLNSRLEHLSAPNDSSSLRIESWVNAIKIYEASPYFGIGFNNYRNYLIGLNITSPENYFLNSGNYSDSSLLSVLTFSGALGLLIFISFYFSYLKNFNYFILLGIIFFNSLVINSMFFPPTAFLIFIMLNLEYD